MSAMPLVWKDVVTLARDRLTNAPVEVAAPQATAQVAPPIKAPPATSTMTPNPTAGGRPKSKCEYCAPLQLGMDTHDHKFCYVDPASQAYKPEVRARRIKAARAKGVQLPAYL